MGDKLVLVTDYTWPSTEPEARVLANVGARLLLAETGSERELLELVPDVSAILTCFARVPASVIQAGTKLEVIGRYGIGVDNIDVDTATRLGIPVTNVPIYCLDEVAEHTLALIFTAARGIWRYNTAVREGNWELGSAMPLFRMRGCTLGILGFGKIGRTVAAKARGLGLRILVGDSQLSVAAAEQLGVEAVGLDDVLAQADFVSLHLPLTPRTRGLLNAQRLRLMKPTAWLINTARGAIVDAEALVQALQQGWIAGAAIDVFEPERLASDHPLLALPNVIATPHVAFYSEESVHELQVKAAQNVAAVLDGRRPSALVNAAVLSLPRWAQLRDQ